MKKILFISDNFPPEVNAPASRTYDHCSEWVRLGYNVTVLTTSPNFPQGKVYKGYKNSLISKEIINGINVIRIWSYIAPNKGFFRRIVDQLSFAITSFIYLLFSNKNEYGFIIVTSPQFFTGLTGLLISKIKNIDWFFEVRDLWPEGIILIKKSGFIYKFLELIERSYYENSKGIITVTESFKKDIINRCKINSKKIEVIYNGSNNNLFQFRGKSNKLINELDLKDKFIFGYAGTIGESHAIDFLVRTISESNRLNDKIHFLFIGAGSDFINIEKLILKLGVKNITLIPSVPKKKIPEYISIFDVGIVNLKNNPAYLKVIPSKIFELASMKKPILLGLKGECQKILEKYNAGICFQPEDANDFVDKCLLLYNNRNSDIYLAGLESMSLDFDRKYLAIKMLNFVKKEHEDISY